MSETAPYQRVKTITSHSGLNRFLLETKETGWCLPRQDAIPDPYHYSPVEELFLWKGLLHFFKETSHRRYEVFQVTDIEATSEEAAERAYIASKRQEVTA